MPRRYQQTLRKRTRVMRDGRWSARRAIAAISPGVQAGGAGSAHRRARTRAVARRANAGRRIGFAGMRRAMRESIRPSQRIGSPARLFFQPVEPFLVDDIAAHSHPGRIARVALEPIWEWICRDLLPGEAKAVSDDVGRAFANNDIVRLNISHPGSEL